MRTLYGAFFVLLFVPVASIAAASAGGMRAAFAVSGVVLALTLAQALLPVRPADLVPGRSGMLLWTDRRFGHDIASPWARAPLAPGILEKPGATLYLYISAELPPGTALNVLWDGHLLGQLQGRPQIRGAALPWYRLPVPWSTVRNRTVWEIIVAPAASTAGNGSPSLGAVHYFRPPAAGTHASVLLAGQGHYIVDLDPATPGSQQGRWLIELRAQDQGPGDNQVLAVWY